jgi:hypothetical protein
MRLEIFNHESSEENKTFVGFIPYCQYLANL